MRGGGAGVEENESKQLGRRDIDLGCGERRGRREGGKGGKSGKENESKQQLS